MEYSIAYTIGSSALALLIALIVTHVIARGISKPLAHLRDAASRIGGGDFKAADTLAVIRSRDEIGALAASFRQMAGDLSEAKDREIRQQRLSALGQIAGSVSHELRNPLGTIRNSMSTVRKAATEKGLGIDRALDRIDRSVERCDIIVSDILEFTRVQELRREATPIDAWLGEMMDEHEVLPSVAIRREFTAGAEVMLDRTRFRQVLVNLIDNAAQAMTDPQWTPGTDRRTITVRTEAIGPHVHLIIADNGPGIPKDELGKIFEPLFTTKTKGIGLGLPTVVKLIEQHGGTIKVESKVGEGTTFTVSLLRHIGGGQAPRAGQELRAA